MKCIRCQNDCTYPQRSNRKCPKCGGEFAFEPRLGDLINDVGFQAAIDAVSSKGSVRWGVENLYYEVGKRIFKKKSSISAASGCLGCFGGLILLISFSSRSWPGGFVAVILIVAAIIIGKYKTASPEAQCIPLELSKFNSMWSHWTAVHGKPNGMIVRQPQPKKPVKFEADLADYSFDRAVICDRARTVDLLLANNFHFENNCAILSVEGYPPGPFKTVRAMLKKNPKLEVFALHDATVEGCHLARRLSTDPEWFAGQAKVIDVGLRPVHAKNFNGQFQLAQVRVISPNEAISAEEAAWLSNYSLELAAIRPEQVLKRLFRAINKIKEDTSSDGGSTGVMSDSSSFSSDAGTSDGGADSFG